MVQHSAGKLLSSRWKSRDFRVFIVIFGNYVNVILVLWNDSKKGPDYDFVCDNLGVRMSSSSTESKVPHTFNQRAVSGALNTPQNRSFTWLLCLHATSWLDCILLDWFMPLPYFSCDYKAWVANTTKNRPSLLTRCQEVFRLCFFRWLFMPDQYKSNGDCSFRLIKESWRQL